MDRTSAFVTAFLCGGAVLLIAVVLLFICVRRLKKQVENVPTPVYDEACRGLERLKKKSRKRKKNDYRVARSPVPRRQQSTLYRNDSNEIVTFVPSINDPPISDYNDKAPSSSTVESFEMKKFVEIHKPEQTNVGKMNEAFVSEDNNFTWKEQRLQEQIHAQNVKKPKLNSPCQEHTQERPESTKNVTAWEKRSRGQTAGHSSNSGDAAVSGHSHSREQIVDSSKPNLGISSKQEDNTHAQFAKHLERRGLLVDDIRQTNLTDPYTQGIDGEQQLYSNQETDTMAEQACNDSERTQNTEEETLEPIYMNVGTLALTNNPEVHLITDGNMPGEFQNSLATQAVDCSQESNENQNYVIEEDGDCSQNGYRDYSGQNQYQEYNGQKEYQDYSGQNDYQGYNHQNVYQGYNHQNVYQDYNNQNVYQDYNGQNVYQDYNGQNVYQDYNGQNMYQDYNGQIELVEDSSENPDESGFYGNLNQNSDANELQLAEDGDCSQSRHQSLHRQSGEHSNQGFQEEGETEQIYENSAEGEEDNFYFNPNC